MGFLGLGNKATSQFASGLSLNFLHSQECSVCPINHRPGLCNAKAKPTGTKEPLIYVLGDAPTKEDDEKGLNLSSDPVIRRYWSKSSREDTRWSSVIRCAPPLLKGKLREPLPIEMEACRPSIERDIEATRPEAIFGFGNAALRWAIGEAGIMKWTGRRLPIKVGSHTCWFYPLISPQQVRDKRLAFENRIGRKLELPPGRYATEDEFAFHLHLVLMFQSLYKRIYFPTEKLLSQYSHAPYASRH
jgi:uracil-DNA glycosylase family 4